ncbi:MAG: hypothetical protein ABIA75_07000, partial [Candidatus Neomarinimicrobiota bacterium]
NKLSDLHLYYTPTNISTNLNVSETYTEKEPRAGTKTTTDYSLGMTRAYTVDYKMTESLKSIKYSRNATSDLEHYRGYAWMAVRDLDPGIVTNSTENLSLTYTPALLDWLSPNFNYSAGYRWSKPLSSTIDGANIGTALKFSSSLSLNPTKLVELVYKPPAKAPVRRARGAVEDEEIQKKEKSAADKPVLRKIHELSKNINPISFRYSSNLNRSGIGVQGEVPAGYKFGWLPDHGLTHAADVGSNTGDWSHDQDIGLNSGFKLTKSITTTLGFSQRISSSIGGTGVETRTLTRDLLPYGDRLENGIPFPSWSLRWTGLQELPLIKKIARTVTLDHSFKGSENHNWRFDDIVLDDMPLLTVGSFIDDYEDYERSSKVSANFAPLLGVTMALNKGISVNTRVNYSKAVDRLENGFTKKIDKSLTSSANYSHKGGLSIPLPFMKDFNIQNTVTFTFNFDYNESETRKTNDIAEGFTLDREMTSWKAGLRISYTFTSKVSGGVIYEYRESDNNISGRKIDRDFGFDVNIAISG